MKKTKSKHHELKIVGYDAELEELAKTCRRHHLYTKNDEAIIKRYYNRVYQKDLARRLNVTEHSLKHHINAMKGAGKL